MRLNVISILLLSAVVTGIYRWQFFDDGSSIKAETEKLVQEKKKVEKEIKNTQKEIEKAVNFDDSVKTLKKELEYFYNYIPKDLTNRHMFEILTRLLQRSGMVTLSMQGSGSQKKTNLYDVLTVRISAEGKFSHFLIFLSLLTNLDQIVSVSNVRINPVNQGVNSTGKITANFDVLGFRYNISTAAQNKST